MEQFADGRNLAQLIAYPPSPPQPPCLPDWQTTPGMACLGPAPPSFEPVADDNSAATMGFAVMGLVAVIGLLAVARARSKDVHQQQNPLAKWLPRLCSPGGERAETGWQGNVAH